MTSTAANDPTAKDPVVDDDMTKDSAVGGSLRGGDFAAVCARFGAPLGCAHDGAALQLRYRTTGAGERADAVVLVDGVVVSIADDIERSPVPCCGQELVGQPVEQALPPLGPALRTEVVGESTRFEFARFVVTAHEGTVACVVPLAAVRPAS